MNREGIQQCYDQEDLLQEERNQDYSSPTYRARSLSKKQRINGFMEEMSHDKGIQSICVLGLNHLISMSCDKQIKIWNYPKQEAIFQYQNGCTSCNNLLKVGLRHYLCISGDHCQQLQLIEWNEMKIIQNINLEEKVIYLDTSPQFASDHTIICGDIKGSLLLLNIDMNILSQSSPQSNQLVYPLKLVKKIKNKDNSIGMQSVSALCFLQDINKVAVGGDKGSIYFYNLQKSKIYKHIPKAHINGRKVSFIAQFHKNDKQYIISAGCDQFIRIFDEETLSVLKQVSVNNPIVCGIQIDNEFAAIGEGRHVLLIGLQNLSTHSLMLHKARVNVITQDKDKSNLIIGDINGTLKVWSLKKDFKSLSNDFSQQSSLYLRQSRQMEYPSTVRKSGKFDEVTGGSNTSRNEYFSYSNTNRYDSNTQRYIKNILKSSENKREESSGRLIKKVGSNNQLITQQSTNGKLPAAKQQQYIIQSQSTDYNGLSTDRKTPLTGQNPSIVSNYAMSGQSNKILKNSSLLRNSSGKKIATFIIPLQAYNQNKLESKSLQNSMQMRNSEGENNYAVLVNGVRQNFESLVNVQSTNQANNNDQINNSKQTLTNLIQRAQIDDIQSIQSYILSQNQINQTHSNQTALEEQNYQSQYPEPQGDTHENQNEIDQNRIQEIQYERQHAQENFYYDLIKHQANQNYVEKGYMDPQTPSQSINQFLQDEDNIARANQFDQNYPSNQFFQQHNLNNMNQQDKTGKQVMCEPYDMPEYDDKLKQKLEFEERDLRNQIKQQEEEFRNSIMRAQSNRSIASSVQEKSSSIIDPAVISQLPATYSIASQHCSNNQQQNQIEDYHSVNLENLTATKQTNLIETSSDNVISQQQFKELLNQIRIEEQNQINNQEDLQQGDNQIFEDNIQDQNETINKIERRSSNPDIVQNQLRQSYDNFKQRLLLLEEQQLLNHQQILQIKEVSQFSVDENMKIKNEIKEIRNKLAELNRPSRVKKNIASLSSKRSSNKEIKVFKKNNNTQQVSPYRIKGRLINSFQGSDNKNDSEEKRMNTEFNQENEENQMKKSLRQQINETIQSYKQSQYVGMRSSQKLTTQKFQSPSKIQVSQANSPQKNYIEMNRVYVSPLKVNWKHLNNDLEISELIKNNQINNKMRSLSTDFLGLRKLRDNQIKQEDNEQIDPKQRKLNFDYSNKISEKRTNSMNPEVKNKQIFDKSQSFAKEQIQYINTSMFEGSNYSNTIKEDEFHKHFQNISAIEMEKQSLKNNQLLTTLNSSQAVQKQLQQNQSQNLQPTENSYYYQYQNNKGRKKSNSPQKEMSKQINNNHDDHHISNKEFKKVNYRQLQNILKGDESNKDKMLFNESQLNNSNKFNNESKFINKNLIYNPQNYKIQNFIAKNPQNQGYSKKKQEIYQITINGVIEQNQSKKIGEEKDDHMDTLQNVSYSLNQPLSSFLTNVQTNQTKNNFTSQQLSEFAQIPIPQSQEKEVKDTYFYQDNKEQQEEQKRKEITKNNFTSQQQSEFTQKPIPQSQEKEVKDTCFYQDNKEQYQEQKRKEILMIQNSQNLSNQVQKEFNECIQGMKDCLAQNRNDLDILKKEMKEMDLRRRNSRGRIPDHYSSALNFIQEQNQLNWESSQRSYSSRQNYQNN